MKICKYCILLVITSLLWNLFCGQPASAQNLEKIRIAYSGTGTNNYVTEVAQRTGIFRRNGLDAEVIYIGSGSLLMQALVAGTFLVGMSQGSEAIAAKLAGVDVRIAATIANHFNHVFLTSRAITSVKQLKGKRVAVSRFGSGSHFMTNLVLKEGGLDPDKDVTALQIGNSAARMAAILSGTVDGTIMAGDFIPKARREGFNILVDLSDLKIEYPFLTFNIPSATIDRNFKTVKAFIKSASEAIKVFQTDPAAAKNAIRVALRTDDPETLEFALVRSARLLERRPFPTPAAIQMVLEELSSKEPKAKSGRFEDFVDLRALRELDKEGAFK
ncbi:MAG TPA: ABC transporter substrate-binding protein [Candidatus Binatia bacterium]|jgi:NitT/TauT family transport system substrate-binding protein